MTIAGAIRWSSWYGQDAQSRVAQNNLATFQSRAPWFTAVVSPYRIESTGTQSNMDLEIQLAAQAGFKYWAWCWYGNQPLYPSGGNPDLGLQTAFNLYQSSAYNSRMNWCIVASPDDFSSYAGWASGGWQTSCQFWVTQFLDAKYQKVLGNRPLVYLLGTIPDALFLNSYTNTATMVTYLRGLCATAGLGNPYFVVMQGSTSVAATMAGWPADAAGLYAPAMQATALPNTYTDLDTQIRAYWPVAAATPGVSAIVPNCCHGWDNRPRKAVANGYSSGAPLSGMLDYFPIGTPAQVAAHMGAAISFVGANPSACPANTFLTYAWDECDEGGGIIPTLGDPPINTDAAYATWRGANPSCPAPLPTSNMLAAIGAVLRGA